ncbi:bifunctional RNase H/acid phosphatase [Nocardia sp. 348MFTsu5.1]|uniref:bifunctional RNase H/acid phosphatase n=1 Tax=Nocardia sp. 348MFTsu5.1 TaxID=1172185 RepID=UPI0003806471|nr:bifunctional RNase H/acid phosphatase [Nocardia sp. 348MFTsu5.1]
MKVVVEADGGSRGNPGPAGYGAVVFDADRSSVLAERKEALGIATNNVAEYRGLIAGLSAAEAVGADEVSVRMDSKLVVEQMSGRWKIKHPDMIPLAAQAKSIASGFSHVAYTWIPRNQNSHADRLANEAMDAAASGEPEKPTVTPSKPATSAPGWNGAQGAPTRMLLLRHGQTPLSVERRYSGRGNPELTELGRDQAARAAKRLSARAHTESGAPGISAVICSPLGRARETAEAAASALGLSVVVHDGLIETDFGDWEGLTFSEAAQRDPELHKAWIGDTGVAPPGGESFDTATQRILKAQAEIVDRYGAGEVLVVSHVTPIKVLLRAALGAGSSILYRLHLDLASLSIAEFYPDGGASVRLVNDTNHLGEI